MVQNCGWIIHWVESSKLNDSMGAGVWILKRCVFEVGGGGVKLQLK